MIDNFRRFEAGPDPFGRLWQVEYRWQQTAVSIRHSDSVDVKFQIMHGEEAYEKVIALMHTDLLKLSREADRLLTDAWCMKLAGLHIKHMIETDEDMDKTIVVPKYEQLERYNQVLATPAPVRR